MKTRKPVMVWVHGGANMTGSAMGSAGNEPPFEGDKLAARGVVLVTVQHRLGVFGFLAHPELTRASKYHASGNWGLMDLQAALQWVKGNIAKFGGDPNGDGLPAWPRFDGSRRSYMEFTESGPVAKENLRRAFCAVYAENALRQLKH